MSRKSGCRFPACAKPWRGAAVVRDASAGEGRSGKDMRQTKTLERIPIPRKWDAL
jgi:hypothetical protein